METEAPPPLRRLRRGCRGQRVGQARVPGARKKKAIDRTDCASHEGSYISGAEGLWSGRCLLGSFSRRPPDRLHRGCRKPPGAYNEVLRTWARECFHKDLRRRIVQLGLEYGGRSVLVDPTNLIPCWDLMNEWEARKSLENRVPTPARAVQAVTAVALAWDCPGMALCIFLLQPLAPTGRGGSLTGRGSPGSKRLADRPCGTRSDHSRA